MKQTKHILSIFLVLTYLGANAQKFNEYFIDSADQAMDVSGFLNSPAAFMPAPIIITEPALGFGGGMAKECL